MASDPASRALLWRRAVLLVVAGVALHLAAPGLVALVGAAPRLGRIRPEWFALMAGAEMASLGGAWALVRIAVPGLGWRLAAASQLAGNSISRLLPGGAAAGAAVTYRMWASAGIAATAAASGLMVTSVVSSLTLFALPVGALLVAAGSAPVPHGLLVVAGGAGATAVALGGFSALVLLNDSVAWRVQRLVSFAGHVVSRHGASPDASGGWLAQREEVRSLLGRRWRNALAAAVINWGFDIAALVLALAAVGSRPHVSLVVLAYVAGAVLGMIPVTPGGLGFVEAGLLGGLGLAGVATPQAVIAVLAYRVVSYWVPILVGLAIYAHRRNR